MPARSTWLVTALAPVDSEARPPRPPAPPIGPPIMTPGRLLPPAPVPGAPVADRAPWCVAPWPVESGAPTFVAPALGIPPRRPAPGPPAPEPVTPEPVVTACVDVVREIVGMAAGVVDRAPAELAADLNDAGVVLAGGGALLSGLDKVIGDALGIPCRVAEAPQSCGVRGLCRMMEDPKAYRAFFLDSATAGNTWR